MSLVDRTNERIPLNLHRPMTWGGNSEYSIEAGSYEAELYVDVDFDSSCEPTDWVHICFTDEAHDSDRIKMTYGEAGLLHDRLGLILGRSA